MLEIILKKLGVKSIEEYFDNEKKRMGQFSDCETEYKSKLLDLADDEFDFFKNYCIENNVF